MDDAGLQKSAVLLMSLGAEAAAEVFKHLTPKEVQRLGETMARMNTVTNDKVDQVLATYRSEAGEQNTLVADTDEYLKQVLNKALGEDRAGLLLDRILQGNDAEGIESLKWMDPESVGELLRNEHPQIIASILVHLERDHAAAILLQLNERLRNEVVLRVATLDRIQPTALRELNEVLSGVIERGDKGQRAVLGGTKAAAEVLNFIGSSAEGTVIESIRAIDPDLAQSITDQMFVFADLVQLDGAAIQTLLREVQSDSLIVALKGADPELREKIFKNMSSRAAETLREDLESKGPVRVSDVETQQKEILKVVRRLSDEGQIQMGGGGGGDAFV